MANLNPFASKSQDTKFTSAQLYYRAGVAQMLLSCLALLCGIIWMLTISLGHSDVGMLIGIFGSGIAMSWLIPLRQTPSDYPEYAYFEAPDAPPEDVTLDDGWWERSEINALWRQAVTKRHIRECVYVIRDDDVTGQYKIGYSNEPMDRIGYFDVKLPFSVSVTHIIPCKDARRVETILHKRFAHKRGRGEWFTLNASDIEWIKQITQA